MYIYIYIYVRVGSGCKVVARAGGWKATKYGVARVSVLRGGARDEGGGEQRRGSASRDGSSVRRGWRNNGKMSRTHHLKTHKVSSRNQIIL